MRMMRMDDKARSFSISEALAVGWRETKKRFWFWVGVLLLVFGVSLVGEACEAFLAYLGEQGTNAGALVLGTVIYVPVVIFVSLVFQMGLLKMALAAVDGGEPKLNMLWSEYRLIWRFLGAGLLFGVIVGFGFMLLVIPGIIWALMFMLYSYFIVDKRVGVMDSLKRSAEVTRGSRWRLLGFVIVIQLINMLGVMLLGVGLLVTVPVTMIAMAYVYRRLVASSQYPAFAKATPAGM